MARTKRDSKRPAAAGRRVAAGAVPASALRDREAPAPLPGLPLALPFSPMEARTAAAIPAGDGWQYEPKWDGFRCLAFRSGDRVHLQSKSGQPLARYFPEVVDALRKLPARRFVLDGELAIVSGRALAFDALLQRIHPAESRIRLLAARTPAMYMAFDLLVDASGADRTGEPLRRRRGRLEAFFGRVSADGLMRLSPASTSRAQAERWMRELAPAGLDGVIAKRRDEPYRSGERTAMVKVKRLRTADCVVGGFRYSHNGRGVGSLLLGLYNDKGLLDHVGFSSSFSDAERKQLRQRLEPLVRSPGFTGRAPGGPSRWNPKGSGDWQPLRPSLVCEVRFDHFAGDRFRHGTKFLRWRPDKSPRLCRFDQVLPGASRTALASVGLA